MKRNFLYNIIFLIFMCISASVDAQIDSLSPVPPIALDSLADPIYTNSDSTYYNNEDDEELFDPKKYYSKEYAASIITVRNFDTAEWRKLTEKLNYRESKQEKATRKEYTPFKFSDSLKAFLKVLMWSFVIFGIGFIGWLIYKNGGFGNVFNRNSRLKTSESIVDYNKIDEEEISNNDFPSLIKAALGDKNYVMALRLNYLHALKSLEAAELIRWKRDKTNGNYVRELASAPDFQPSFKTLTRQFEIYFYGKFPLSEIQYNNLALEFDGFIQKAQKEAAKIAPID